MPGETKKLSHSRPLLLASTAIGTMCVGFGVNAILRPAHALSFFELEYPSEGVQRGVVDNLMVVYGARDIFMGLAAYIAAYWGSRRVVGGIMLATSLVAFVDGAVCWGNGHGQWNHWGYAPMVLGVGGLLSGGLD
jgi:uncharacterized membrane protein